eukprot:14302073-Alexandrium_andersonii.AAC.1
MQTALANSRRLQRGPGEERPAYGGASSSQVWIGRSGAQTDCEPGLYFAGLYFTTVTDIARA